MNQDRLYNSRMFDAYLKLLGAKYPAIDTVPLLRSVGIEPYEVADQGRWFTADQINRFHAAVADVTGNANIARLAGRHCAAPDTLGTMRQYILSMLTPAQAFSSGNTLSEFLTKSVDLRSQTLTPNSVEIVVTPRNGENEQPFHCAFRAGFFEAIVRIFDYALPKIEHEECLFRGGKACRYMVKWPRRTTGKLKTSRDIYVAGAATLNLAAATLAPASIGPLLPSSVAGLFGLNWWLENSRRGSLERTLGQLRGSMEQLNEQINLNYRNSYLSRVIGEVITSKTSIDDVIEAVTQALEKMLEYDRGLVLLASKDVKRLEIRGAFGYSNDHMNLLETTSFNLDNPNSRGPFTIAFREKKPLLIDDINAITDRVTLKTRSFIDGLGTQSFVTVPIMLDHESIGLLAVDNFQRKKPLVNSDVNLLMGIAPTIGVSFRNAALAEARENQFAATLSVLAHSIDARDFLTAGHSEHVAEYAVGIAEELGKPHEYCHMIRIAALLHDYGKIGVPDTVLKKDGPLTDTERALIQTHSQKSFDILDQVPFEGLYREIPEIALYHHERWDGTGYPKGLRGKQIPFGARIIAVADFFEAVTSKRHYREPMSDPEAVQLLKEDSGKHFDPQIVAAFLRHIKWDHAKKEGARRPHAAIHPKLAEPRYNFEAPVYAQVADLRIAGKTIDISEGGVYLQMPENIAQQIEPHSVLQIMLDLPNAKSVEVAGEVRWFNLTEERPAKHLPAGIGVAFKELDQNVRQLISEAVRKLVRGQESPFSSILLNPGN
jgi:HD-GYP domain-containing protein (c-di-GMP phosphodiesterase class II)